MTSTRTGSTVGQGFLAAEFALLFIALPVAVFWAGPGATALIIPMLLGASLYAWIVLRHSPEAGPPAQFQAALPTIFQRFLLGGALLTLTVWWLTPEDFLRFPREKPRMWLIVMLAYPLLSVAPQEFLYRRFFFTRYASLVRSNPAALIALSTLVFSWGHLLFRNIPAIALTALGGLLFSLTYARSRSLTAACLEHALWGNLIFTVGLGRYFYHGSVQAIN